jgi:hypothetical protein
MSGVGGVGGEAGVGGGADVTGVGGVTGGPNVAPGADDAATGEAAVVRTRAIGGSTGFRTGLLAASLAEAAPAPSDAPASGAAEPQKTELEKDLERMGVVKDALGFLTGTPPKLAKAFMEVIKAARDNGDREQALAMIGLGKKVRDVLKKEPMLADGFEVLQGTAGGFEALVETFHAIDHFQAGDVGAGFKSILKAGPAALKVLPKDTQTAIEKKVGNIGAFAKLVGSVYDLSESHAKLGRADELGLSKEQRADLEMKLLQNLVKCASAGLGALPKDVIKEALPNLGPYLGIGTDAVVNALPLIEKLSRWETLSTADKLQLSKDFGTGLGPDVVGLLATAAFGPNMGGLIHKAVKAGSTAFNQKLEADVKAYGDALRTIEGLGGAEQRFLENSYRKFRALGMDEHDARALARMSVEATKDDAHVQQPDGSVRSVNARYPGLKPLFDELYAEIRGGDTVAALAQAEGLLGGYREVSRMLAGRGADDGHFPLAGAEEDPGIVARLAGLHIPRADVEVRWPTDGQEAGARANRIATTNNVLARAAHDGDLSPEGGRVADAMRAGLARVVEHLVTIERGG